MIVRIRLLPDAVEVGHLLSRQAAPWETGGIALGWYEKGCIVVAELVEVPDTNSTTHTFQRDPVGGSQVLRDRIRIKPDIGYVGEWHSHPALVPPSPTDRRSIRRLARSSPMPLALVVIALGGEGDYRTYNVPGSTMNSRAALRRLARPCPDDD